MDKAKLYLAWLVKYHFWVLSGTTVLLGFIGWLLSANALAEYYKQRKSKIDTKHSIAQKIMENPNHPNGKFEEGVNRLLDQKGAGLKSRVLAAWSQSYDEQKNGVLIWPQALGEDCLQVIASAGDKGEIPVDFRERYFNYVRNEFPELLKIVDAQNHNQKAPRAGEPAQAATSHLVIWRSDDQRLLDEALDWPRAPSSKEMRYVQENLWVYRALLTIIAKVNEGSTANFNAKIKEIIAMQIARPAALEFQIGMGGGKLIPPQPIGQPVGVQSGMAPAAPAAAAKPLSKGGGGRGGQGASLAFDSVQDEGRYVDAKGQPLTHSDAAPPEFKRMPVFLQLYMDQREIARLLVECANSPLPVEVQQLRINPGSLRRPGRTDVTSVFVAGNKAGGGGSAPPRVDGGGGNVVDRELNPYDVPIEIEGIIYIFNPPNRAKLNVVGQAAGAATADAVEAPAPSGPAPSGPAATSEPAAAGAAGGQSPAVAPVNSAEPPAAPVAAPPAASP